MDKRLYTRLIEAIDSSQSLETTLNEFSEEIKDIYKRIAVIEVELQLFNNQETLFKASLNPGYQKLPELYKSFSTWDNYISTTSMVDFLGIQKPNKCAADVARGVCAVLRMEYGDGGKFKKTFIGKEFKSKLKSINPELISEGILVKISDTVSSVRNQGELIWGPFREMHRLGLGLVGIYDLAIALRDHNTVNCNYKQLSANIQDKEYELAELRLGLQRAEIIIEELRKQV